MKNLQFVKHSTWDEVFDAWKLGEGSDPHWHAVATDVKGWNSWEEWRGYQSSQIDAQNRVWNIFAIQNPNETIPHFQIGPFRGWQNNFPDEEKNTHTFAELVKIVPEWVKNNVGIKSRRENFPQETQFIGIYVEDIDKIILYEGHHRAAAIALAIAEGAPLTFTQLPTIAITKVPTLNKQFLDDLLLTGSHNPLREDLK